MIKLTIQQLEEILSIVKDEEKYHSGNGSIIISDKDDKMFKFELPCSYKECNSTYLIYPKEKA